MAVKTRGAGRLAMVIRSTTLRDRVLAPFRHEWPHLNLLVDGPPHAKSRNSKEKAHSGVGVVKSLETSGADRARLPRANFRKIPKFFWSCRRHLQETNSSGFFSSLRRLRSLPLHLRARIREDSPLGGSTRTCASRLKLSCRYDKRDRVALSASGHVEPQPDRFAWSRIEVC